MFRAVLLTACCAAFVSVVGCGSSKKGVVMTGKVLTNNAPLKFPDNTTMSLQFIPSDPQVSACSAEVKLPSGEFTVVGPTPDIGLQPGSYKIAASAVVSGKYKDLLGEAFAPNNTPLSYTVTADPTQSILIDLGRKLVTKN